MKNCVSWNSSEYNSSLYSKEGAHKNLNPSIGQKYIPEREAASRNKGQCIRYCANDNTNCIAGCKHSDCINKCSRTYGTCVSNCHRGANNSTSIISLCISNCGQNQTSCVAGCERTGCINKCSQKRGACVSRCH